MNARRWADLELLFGPNGACGGCWCMYWRQRLGERWETVKGETNRRRLRALARRGRLHGAIAYEGDEPVGWVSFERRVDLPRLDRAPSLACDDAASVWSLPCFYIKAKWRRRGVASALLAFAVTALRKRGARTLEAYPVRMEGRGKITSPAFAWTGAYPMFARAGFREVGPRRPGKQRMRLGLRGVRA
jgi:GNAT superfamily N-acetyltransferase